MTVNIINNSNFRIVKPLREPKSISKNYPEDFEFEFSDYPGTDTIVDLSDISEIDMSFLYKLTRLYKSCHKNGGRVVLANIPHAGRDLLEMSGFASILPTAKDFNEAIKMLKVVAKVS